MDLREVRGLVVCADDNVKPMKQVAQHLTPQLCMRRLNLDDLPTVALPHGYLIRTCREGDASHWARIMRESFADSSFDDARFDREMRAHPAYRPERIFFVCAPDGLPCGTAGAYRKDRFGPDSGYLHYVGVCPAHTGMRLGTAVSRAALEKLRSEGLQRVFLETDDFRLPAIRTYLKLGFSPLIVDQSQRARWDAIFAKLGIATPKEYETYV